MSEPLVDNAEATTAADEADASLEENVNPEIIERDDLESMPEDERLKVTQNTQNKFDEFGRTIQQLQADNAQLRQDQSRQLDYEDPGAPKAEDFDTDEEFWVAKGTHEATRNMVGVINQNQVKQAQDNAQFDQTQRLNSYNQKAEALKVKEPEFQKVVGASLLHTQDAQGNLTPATQAILAVENGPEVAMHIAMNPQLALRMNQLDPINAGIEVSKLSSQLSAKPAPANAPPAPIGSEDTGTGLAPSSDGLQHIGKASFE